MWVASRNNPVKKTSQVVIPQGVTPTRKNTVRSNIRTLYTGNRREH